MIFYVANNTMAEFAPDNIIENLSRLLEHNDRMVINSLNALLDINPDALDNMVALLYSYCSDEGRCAFITSSLHCVIPNITTVESILTSLFDSNPNMIMVPTHSRIAAASMMICQFYSDRLDDSESYQTLLCSSDDIPIPQLSLVDIDLSLMNVKPGTSFIYIQKLLNFLKKTPYLMHIEGDSNYRRIIIAHNGDQYYAVIPTCNEASTMPISSHFVQAILFESQIQDLEPEQLISLISTFPV